MNLREAAKYYERELKGLEAPGFLCLAMGEK